MAFPASFRIVPPSFDRKRTVILRRKKWGLRGKATEHPHPYDKGKSSEWQWSHETLCIHQEGDVGVGSRGNVYRKR
ncbi:MAG: hypothetical protein D6812_13140 [Deltaproteobacteria bacterium]|nr:MAG: hypothetical protein D6812_13140 [Deltaproteobacteria bacterium]